MSEHQAAEQQLADVTRDPARARQLRRSLETIADRADDPAMREMAREVLSGRLNLRDAANVPQYGEAVRQGMQEGLCAYASMSAEERRMAEEEGRRQLDGVHRELDDEQRDRFRPRGGPSKHSGRGWKL